MWDLLRILTNISTAVVFQYLMIEPRYPRRTTLAAIGFGTLVIAALNAPIIGLYGFDVFLRFYPLTIHVPYLALYAYLARHRGFKILFVFLTTVALCFFISLAAGVMSMPFGALPWLTFVLRLILAALSLWLSAKYVRPRYLPMMEMLRGGWGLFCLMPLGFYAYGYFILMRAPRAQWLEQAMPMLLVSLIMAAGYGVIFQFFHEMDQKTQRENERQLLRSQVRAFEDQAELLKDSEKKLGTLRHDMRHYFSNISALLQKGETEEALRFLDAFDQVAEGTKLSNYCENVTMNIILSYYIEKAERAGIRVETNLDIPEKLPVDTIALSTVFANAIENAVAACERIPEGRERRIELTCFSWPRFVLEIANTYEGSVSFGPDGLPLSDRPGHGIGIRSIAAFARENGAVCDCQAGNGLFRLRILIQ